MVKAIMQWLQVRPAQKFGTALGRNVAKHHYEFEMGSLIGVVKAHKNTLTLVFIGNTQPHNGQFIKFTEQLEKAARIEGVRLEVGPFMNARLLGFYLRRGYHFIPRREHVLYDPECRAIYPDGLDEMLQALVDNRMEQALAYGRSFGLPVPERMPDDLTRQAIR